MKSITARPLWVAAAILALATLAWLERPGGGGQAATAKNAAQGPATTVDVATVRRVDVPVYLEGLGAVQALNTVTVTARVDGQLDRVAFIEGQEVHKGTLLAQIDPRPFQAALDQAVAIGARDAAQLENARLDLRRYEQLAPEELASKQTVDTQRALVAQLEAQVRVDAASADSARTQLAYTTITSPIDGRTGIRLVDAGNIVHASDTTGIVVLTQLQPVAAIVSLPEDVVGEVNAALARGAVTALAVSRDHHEEIDHGIVMLIDNQIDATTGTVRLKATFPNAHRRLWPGEFINVQVLTEVKRQALVIPQIAVQRGPDGVYAYVVQPDSTVEAVPLKVGTQWNDLVVVDQGLETGQRVVVSNHYRLQPKASIKISAAAKALTGGAP
jgi:membrane fusion protein, multidrug efflux system